MTMTQGQTSLDGTIEASGRAREPVNTRGRVKAVIWGVALLALTVFFLATAVTGPAGDERITNPNPRGDVLVGGVPRSEAPFLGVENWPLVFSLLFVVVATLVVAPMVVVSIRRRAMTHGLIVFLSVAVLAWLDPPANWVTYTVYDPRFLHFPTNWPWMRLSPSVEPLMVIPGYPFYYFVLAMLAFGGFQRYVLPRLRPGGWWRRHPRVALFTTAFLLATVWDVATELFMIRARMYFYSQSWGPTLRWGPTHAGFPIIWGLFTIVSIAAISVLLYRDDDGGSVLTSVARRLPRFRRTAQAAPTGESSGRQILSGVLVLSVVYVALLVFFGMFRVTGLAHNTFHDKWPYQEIKTYDPDGILADHGVPGPYYR
jgi:hypothetical protein